MKKNFAKISTNKGKVKSLLDFASFVLTKPGFEMAKRVAKKALRKAGLYQEVNVGYHDWITKRLDIIKLKEEYSVISPGFSLRPVFSIVIPVYNPPPEFLRAAIDSVRDQLYDRWELCLSDDVSPNPEVRKVLSEYAAKDKRIKVVFREENGHISANTNSALTLATGDYILFMDHDDLLTPNCLSEFVRHINAHPYDEIIYSDEDKIDDEGKYSMPHFKPDWAPDNLLSRNYMGHVIVVSRNIMDQVKGFRLGFEGSQDHDFLLRATELTRYIGHIPKVLYHWRIHQASVASNTDAKPYAYIAAQKALDEALIRRGTPGHISHIPDTLGGYRIHYDIVKPGKVSVIIPTKDQVGLLKGAIDSIINRTDYPDFEIIVLNNNSSTPEFFELMADYQQKHSDIFRCIDANFKFNFARLMNIGVAASKGDYILLANNDIEVIESNWMTEMVSFAQQKHAGAVGVKLLYKDDTIQHAGVVLGLGGAAGHVFINMHKNDRGYFNYIKSLNNYSAVTAACVMCRKEIYQEVGGMDEMLDVEYNDVDLCLKFLTHGYFNVYIPDVEVYHYESATRGHPFQSKESWAQHEKDFGIFRGKWQSLIDNDPFYSPNLSIKCTDFQLKPDSENGDEPEPPIVRPGRTVLIVHKELPDTYKNAEARSISNITDMLINLGCDVVFWAPEIDMTSARVAKLKEQGVEIPAGAGQNDNIYDYISENLTNINIVLLSHASVSRNILDYLRSQKYSGHIVYYGGNPSFITAGKEASVNGDASLIALTEEVKVNEYYMFHSAGSILISNETEIARLKEHVLTPIHYIPECYFEPKANTMPYEERSGILFLGNTEHRSDMDGLIWFLDEVYKPLAEKGINLTIPVTDIPQRLKGYQERFPSISLVPTSRFEDMADKCRVGVAPQRLISDINDKMLEAMSAGLPISGTDSVFRGLLRDNEFIYKGVNSAAALSDNITALYTDADKWQRLSAFGRKYVRANYGKEKMKEAFKKAFRNM